MKIPLFGLVLIVVACAPVAPVPQNSSAPVERVEGVGTLVRLSAERVSSSRIRLALDNGAPRAIGYNLCTSELQRRVGSGWLGVSTGDVCTMQLLSLNPGRDATFEKDLPAGLTAGEYRYVASIEDPLGSPQQPVATEPFSIK